MLRCYFYLSNGIHMSVIHVGMDMQGGKEGGSWLAMNTDGRIGILLNILGERNHNAAKGRGRLVSAFVTGSDSAKDYVDKVAAEGNDYNGFHLLAVNMYNILNIHLI